MVDLFITISNRLTVPINVKGPTQALRRRYPFTCSKATPGDSDAPAGLAEFWGKRNNFTLNFNRFRGALVKEFPLFNK
jgi:hypothetical protein